MSLSQCSKNQNVTFENSSLFKMLLRVLFLGGLRKYDHITPLMRDQLHWLPISSRIDYKVAVLTYKALHHQSPDYMTAMCCLAADSLSISGHRSAANGDLIPAAWNSFFMANGLIIMPPLKCGTKSLSTFTRNQHFRLSQNNLKLFSFAMLIIHNLSIA